MKRFLRFGAAVCCALASAWAVAADFPTRPVTIIVPYAPGGLTDHYARSIGNKLSQKWQQTVVVDNRAGGGTVIGTQQAVQAKPDGYTLLLTSYGFTSNPILMKNLSYDPKALTPLAMVGHAPNMLVLSGRSELTDLQSVVERARSGPGALRLASSGNASSPHIAAALFEREIGADITHVAYRGTAPAMTDVMGGQVDGIFDGVSAMPNVEAGRLKAVAIAADERHPAAPDVPTFRELGIDLEFGSWFGFFVPTDTPQAVQEQLNADLQEAMADPEVEDQLTKSGLRLRPGPAEEFAEFLDFESQRLRQLAESGSVTID